MNDITSFWKNWENYISVSVLFALFVPLLLTGKLIEADFSLLLLPISYIMVKHFYGRNSSNKENVFIAKLFIYSFLIRIVCIFVFAEILKNYIDIPFLSIKDDYEYNNSAIEIVNRWKSSGIGFYADIHWGTGFYSGFPNFSALFMYIFGESIYVPRIANAFFSSWTCLFAYHICRVSFDTKTSRLVAILFMVSPLLYLYSSLQLKDTVHLFLIFGSILSIVNTLNGKNSLLNIIRLIIFLILMIFFRAASIVPILSAVLICYIFYIGKKRRRKVNIFSILSVTISVIVFYYGWSFLSELNSIDNSEVYFESRYNAMANFDIKNSSIGISKFSFAEIIGLPLYILFSPFLPPPLLVSLPNAETINFTMYGLLLHYSLLPFLVVAIIVIVKNRKSMIVSIYIFLVFVFFKIGQANAYVSILNVRQSLASIYLMYLLFPAYFSATKQYKNIKNIVMIISFTVMLIYAGVRLYSRGLV